MLTNSKTMGNGGFTMIKTITSIKNWTDLPLVMTTASVSKLTHISVVTIKRHCREGKIKANKPSGEWMISREAVMEYCGLAPADVYKYCG
jgi:excisionase family DNA binding protein